MLWWLLLFTFALYIYKQWKHHYEYWLKLNIPYVKCPPVFGNMAPFVFRKKTLPELVQDIYNSYNGRYVGIFLFDQPGLLIKDLNLLKQIAIKDFDHFVDRKPFVSVELDPLLGQSLVSLTGQKWKHMRSILSPAFTSHRIRAMFVLINESTEQFTNYFMKRIEPNKTTTVELKDIYMRFACDMIASVGFGISCDSMTNKQNEFYQMAKASSTLSPAKVMKFFGAMTAMPVMKLLKLSFLERDVSDFFRNIVKDTIKACEREGIVRPDMLHLLAEARKGQLKHDMSKNDEDVGFASVEESDVGKENSSNTLELTNDVLTAQTLIFLLGGFDSVSTVLSFTCYELALNMDVQEKLQIEIDMTLRECEGKFTHEAISRMKYLDMVLCESLRKWPPGVVPERICTKSYVILPETQDENPVLLRKGDPIWIPAFAIHRDPTYYPEPETFDPERFNDKNKVNILPYTYIPFGIGPRNCIGSRFAIMETKTVLVHFLSKFTFVVVDKTQIPIKPSKWQFNMQVNDGYWLGLQRRN